MLQIAPIVAPIRMLINTSDLVGSLVSWLYLVQIFHVRPYFCLNEHTVQRFLIQSESPFTCLMDIYPDFLPHVPQPCTTTALIPRGISMSSCLQDRFLQKKFHVLTRQCNVSIYRLVCIVVVIESYGLQKSFLESLKWSPSF